MNNSIYQNCRELPIHNFNEVIITGDLNFLIKDKSTQDPEELKKAWDNILSEFHDISDDKAYKKILSEKAEIIYLKGKVLACQIIIEVGSNRESEEILKGIKELRKRYRVRDARNTLAATKNKLKLKIAQFERMTTHEESKVSLGSMIANVSRILGYKIDRFTTTVEEWVELLKTADEIVKESKKKKKVK